MVQDSWFAQQFETGWSIIVCQRLTLPRSSRLLLCNSRFMSLQLSCQQTKQSTARTQHQLGGVLIPHIKLNFEIHVNPSSSAKNKKHHLWLKNHQSLNDPNTSCRPGKGALVYLHDQGYGSNNYSPCRTISLKLNHLESSNSTSKWSFTWFISNNQVLPLVRARNSWAMN